jgi:hypothetical protein
MAKNSFDFFQDHSLRNLEMALRSDHQALIKSPDGYGKRTGVCGDTVEFYLQVREDAPGPLIYGKWMYQYNSMLQRHRPVG